MAVSSFIGKRWCPEITLAAVTIAAAAGLASTAGAQLAPPDWVERLHLGNSLTAGLSAFTVDAAGVSYVTGIGGPSDNTDAHTAAYGPDGTLLWSEVYNGPNDWHDQSRGIALGPDEQILWVCGNAPSARKDADGLLLKYDADTGDVGLRVAKFAAIAGGLYRLDVTDLIAGRNAIFTITDGASNTRQYITYSLRGFGKTFVPQLNVTLDLANPQLLASGQADDTGSFEANVRIPSAAEGRTVYFQEAELDAATEAFDQVVR